jgi:RNA polymerase sigma-70 factor (ECF subfamily)
MATTNEPLGDRAAEFERHRAHLMAVAYRMLGTLADAEDAVQETYLRFAAVDEHEVHRVRGWLTRVVARICLDELGSARARREHYVGQWLPEPIVRADLQLVVSRLGPEPEDQVTLDESVSLALLVLLESLSPAERTAFVLHEVLGLSYQKSQPWSGARRRPAANWSPAPAPTSTTAARASHRTAHSTSGQSTLLPVPAHMAALMN